MSENSTSYSSDRRTADLLATLTYLETLLPAAADPAHRARLAEIRRRVYALEDGALILRDPGPA